MMSGWVLTFSLIITGLQLCSPVFATGKSTWNIPALNTAVNAEYLSDNEKEVVLEINKLRNNPAAYAAEYLVPMLELYRGRLLYMPGNDPVITKEGISALRDAIQSLKKARPAAPLSPDRRLYLSARDHQRDQTSSGKTGHKGADGSSIAARIERYGDWEKKISENIFYGDPDARSVVLHLVIDDGVPGRGHRINFLDPELRYVGVACGTHRTYRYMCVMNFAAGFRAQNE